MITNMQERIHLIIARKKKRPAIESILIYLMHMQGMYHFTWADQREKQG